MSLNDDAINQYLNAQKENPHISIDEFLNNHPELRSQIYSVGYDNEWIKFIAQLADNESVKDIVDFIAATEWTDRQRKTIMAYARVVLGRGLSTTYFMNALDYRMLYDDKALIDCDIALGMTRFDVTPEFNILLGLINMHFGIESRKSKDAIFLKRIGTQRHEVVQEENKREQKGSFRERMQNKIGL